MQDVYNVLQSSRDIDVLMAQSCVPSTMCQQNSVVSCLSRSIAAYKCHKITRLHALTVAASGYGGDQYERRGGGVDAVRDRAVG